MKQFKKIIFYIVICCLFSILIYAKEDKTTGEVIVETAKQYLGNPYVYGGNSLTNGCDCSHFVWLVLKEAINYDKPYTTSWGFETMGEQVSSLQQAEAGDVICYGPHVAIYDGDGKIVQAKGVTYGITDDREVQYCPIVTIRRFKKEKN